MSRPAAGQPALRPPTPALLALQARPLWPRLDPLHVSLSLCVPFAEPQAKTQEVSFQKHGYHWQLLIPMTGHTGPGDL